MDACVSADRVAVIVGATGGIGSAIARSFVGDFSTLALIGRNELAGAALARELASAKTAADFYRCDVSSPESIRAVVDEILERLGAVHALVNAQGILPALTICETTTLADFDLAYSVNCRSAFLFMKYCLPTLAKVQGSIVNIASVAGTHAFPLTGAYAASKSALIQITRVVAQEYGSRVRANVVAPGWVRTRMMRQALDAIKVDETDAVRAYPFGRAAEPEEIAQAVRWLCGRFASYVSGAVLGLDGGGVP